MNNHSKTTFVSRELIKEEVELRDRPASEISPLWKTLTVTSYLIIAGSGIASSITIGDITAAFENQCIFYARIALINLDDLEGNKTLSTDNVEVTKWGDLYDCNFCEYSAASSVVFGGILFVLFLQCGRGGVTTKSKTRSWEIVLPALLINIIFFIIASVAFAKTVGGLSFFCTNILKESLFLANNNIFSCGDVLSYRFPWDAFDTYLYLDYVIALFGASINFVGWFMALSIIIFRFLLGVDFVMYRRQHFTVKTLNVDEKRKAYSKKLNSKPIFYNSSDSSSSGSCSNLPDSEYSDITDENETTFIDSPIDLNIDDNERKKLI